MFNYLRRKAARTRPTWLLWMTLGSLLLTPVVLLSLVFELLMEIRAVWHWKFKGDLAYFFGAFSERHRLAQKSLGLKPPRP